MGKIFDSIKNRWVAETPILWKIVRNLGAFIGSVSTAILAAEQSSNSEIDSGYKTLLAWGIAIGAIAATFSQMQRKNESK